MNANSNIDYKKNFGGFFSCKALITKRLGGPFAKFDIKFQIFLKIMFRVCFITS